MIGLLSLFHVKQSDFKNIKWFLSYIKKFMEERQKTDFRRNCLTQRPIKIVYSKFEKKQVKNHYSSCVKFSNMYLLNWLKTNASKSVTVGWGRADPGRFITNIYYILKKKYFCSIDHIEKINSFRGIALFESPIWLWKGALLRARNYHTFEWKLLVILHQSFLYQK